MLQIKIIRYEIHCRLVKVSSLSCDNYLIATKRLVFSLYSPLLLVGCSIDVATVCSGCGCGALCFQLSAKRIDPSDLHERKVFFNNCSTKNRANITNKNQTQKYTCKKPLYNHFIYQNHLQSWNFSTYCLTNNFAWLECHLIKVGNWTKL